MLTHLVLEHLVKSFLHDSQGKAKGFVRIQAKEFVRLHLAAAKAIDSMAIHSNQ